MGNVLIKIKSSKTIKFAEYIFSGVFFSGIFIFFTIFYNDHFHFEEQFQLFLTTWDYFTGKLVFPGGFAGYVGQFLTQFYYISVVGPLIVVLLLLILQQVFKKILIRVNPSGTLFPLSFIPSLLAGMILCNEFYPLSAVTGFLTAMIAAMIYTGIPDGKRRFIAGLILLPLTYWLAGGSFLSLLLIMSVYEFLISRDSHKSQLKNKGPESQVSGRSHIKLWYLTAYFVIAVAAPLLVRRYLIMQPLMISFLSEFYYSIRTTIPTAALVLFLLPPVLMIIAGFVSIGEKHRTIALSVQTALFLVLCFFGFRTFANFSAEEIMKYDYLVRNQRWSDVVNYAGKHPPKNYLSLSMLNLSLAKTGQLGNTMFNYKQHGVNGLFLPFSKEYVAPMMGNEIFYSLGLINAAQEYTFESMETIPSLGKSARAIKRLAETNLINGQYKVSEKYLKLLGHTIFYRKWAKNSMTFLNNDEKIRNHKEWGEKRRFMIENDYFFHVKNMEAELAEMVKEHPDNRIAFEYLLAFYMINKDLRNFIKYIPVMENMNYREIPVSYQEAVMYIIGLNNKDPMTNSPAYISQATKARMKAYGDIYTNYRDAREKLRKNYAGTYWYYLHFVEPEKQAEEK
jgi:hypothetical protein